MKKKPILENESLLRVASTTSSPRCPVSPPGWGSRQMRGRLLIPALVLLLHSPSSSAQSDEGMIDFRQSVDTQIRQLEQRVGGDQRATRQAVIYRWLIQLYKDRSRPYMFIQIQWVSIRQ